MLKRLVVDLLNCLLVVELISFVCMVVVAGWYGSLDASLYTYCCLSLSKIAYRRIDIVVHRRLDL